MACSVCKDYRHRAAAHVQFCVICGGDRQELKDAAQVDHNYKCANEAWHRKIRSGFGDLDVVKAKTTKPEKKAKGSI